MRCETIALIKLNHSFITYDLTKSEAYLNTYIYIYIYIYIYTYIVVFINTIN